MATMAAATPSTAVDTRSIWKVILASALGTMIEWYDFYIFGSLAAVISLKFFPAENETAALLSTLATFGAGFAARPFGALVFGRIGDLVGRKYAFLVTLLIMGGATTLIGLMPTYASIGIIAPLILVIIRIIQGLALGGEYGGAAVYVAEHVPDNKRGFYTSFIQITATLGLFVSLAVILLVRSNMSTAAFNDYGWRIPFLLSIFLVGISVYIRSKMKESPLFTKLKSEGKTSTAPIKDSFGSARSWRTFFLVLLGAAAGQAVVWYTGQFYVNTWMKSALKMNASTVDTIVAIALLLGMPFFVVMGSLSDRIGRKKVMMTGNLLGRSLPLPNLFGHSGGGGADHARRERRSWQNSYPGGCSYPQHRNDYAADLRDAALRHDGLWPDRRLPGRVLPGQDSLHVGVAALSLRQWLLRRLAALHRYGAGGEHWQHLRRAVVPNRRSRDDLHYWYALPEGNQPRLDPR
ncbi:MAG: MFS transporter [Kouleothrix sp.]